MLEAVGISPAAERVYEVLISHGSSTAATLAGATGLGEEGVPALLDELMVSGLVRRALGSVGMFVAASPVHAVEALVHQREGALEQIRAHARVLDEELRTTLERREPAAFVEIVTGVGAILAAYSDIQAGARREVRSFTKPPFASPENPSQGGRIAEGIRYRGVWDQSLIEDPDGLRLVQRYADMGEEIRIAAEVPLKLVIIDEEWAMLPLLEAPTSREPSAVLLRKSVLLESLVALFERVWERAAPMHSPAQAPAEVDSELLHLLALGLKDEAIARQLGVNVRTIGRRVRRLLEELGVGSRFQAGIVAVERGWISRPSATTE